MQPAAGIAQRIANATAQVCIFEVGFQGILRILFDGDWSYATRRRERIDASPS
jgi:hypothetical protein